MASIQCVAVASCFSLRKQFPSINSSNPSSLVAHPTTTTTTYLKSLSFSRNLSETIFSNGSLAMKVVERPSRRSVVCEAAPTKKADSAAKRARQAEKRRIYNKSKKSELKTRMKKVLDSLDVLQKKTDAQSEEIISIEKLIAEAYSAIDKAVKAGALHRNTGANRKSRLARRKKTVEIHHGWYTPASPLKV
ncbi:30S ribosomal protein S20, chloroplastic-like [Thalictrum thalictroides]|uniref:Small ribosomal subunit protein bS20c n=1 Tax=Thalictrum thalictroides TaxID=46969 RepID=A0A7J6V148_THATH|nr:30S ribosomal protein S20, chloroplastic-like [Thalictrum thalictroides]